MPTCRGTAVTGRGAAVALSRAAPRPIMYSPAQIHTQTWVKLHQGVGISTGH